MNAGKTSAGGDLVVGLDCSTTATKAIAFDRAGAVVARASERIPLTSTAPNAYEQEAEDWWKSACRALTRITGQIDPRRIRALAVSNQRETFVPLDRKGRCLRPAILWLDERCKDEVEPFSERIGKTRIHRITGKPPDYAPVVYRLAWMRRHEPRLFRNIGMVCDVHSYLVWKLTGSFSTSWASADPLGVFDIAAREWSETILDALGLAAGQFPSLCQPGTVIGAVSCDSSMATGLDPRTLVVAGGGDGQAAGLGSNVLSTGRAYLNLGTAVVAGVFGTRYRTNRAFRTLCSCSDGGYYFESSLRAGTFAIDWLIRNILNIDPSREPSIYRTLEKEAGLIRPGCDGLFHLPYLCGVMNPYWDMNARGAFSGLSSSHRRGHLYRAILEGIAFEQRSAIGAIEKVLGVRVLELVAIGGGAGEFWSHIVSDITGRRIRIPVTAEASALGAAIAAAVGGGWYRSFRGAARNMTGTGRTIVPDPDRRREYERLYPIYRTIYPSLRKLQK